MKGAPVADEQLLADLREVATRLGKNTVGQKEYRRLGTYDDTFPAPSYRIGRRPGSLITSDWAVQSGVFKPKRPDHASSAFIGAFTSAHMAHVHFEEGKPAA